MRKSIMFAIRSPNINVEFPTVILAAFIGIFPKTLMDYIGTDGKKEQQVRRKDLIILDQAC